MTCTITHEVANYHISQLSQRNNALDMMATELEFTSPLSLQPTARKLFAFDDVSNANDLQHTYVGRVPLKRFLRELLCIWVVYDSTV